MQFFLAALPHELSDVAAQKTPPWSGWRRCTMWPLRSKGKATSWRCLPFTMLTSLKMRKMMSQLFNATKTGKEPDPIPQTKLYLPKLWANPDQATMPTAMGNTATTANYMATHRKNAGRESMKRNLAKTGKDELVDPKCSDGHEQCKKWTKWTAAGLSLKSLMTPHIQAPSIITQFILSLCTISITTGNKLLEIMMPFWGKTWPRLMVKAGDKTFSWLFDTGAAVTCMKRQSFVMAFEHTKPRKISEAQTCVATSGNKMSSLGVFEVNMWIKGRKIHSHCQCDQWTEWEHYQNWFYSRTQTHIWPVMMTSEICRCLCKLYWVSKTDSITSNDLYSGEAKYKGKADPNATHISNICTPRMPMVLGMPSIVSVNKNNICNLVIENCTQYNVTLVRHNILGIMEMEVEELVPLTDYFILSICQEIQNCFPKVKRKRLSRKDIQK
jgi:hypothetical protein